MMTLLGRLKDVYCSTIFVLLRKSCSFYFTSFSSSGTNRSTATIKQNPDVSEMLSGNWVFSAASNNILFSAKAELLFFPVYVHCYDFEIYNYNVGNTQML